MTRLLTLLEMIFYYKAYDFYSSITFKMIFYYKNVLYIKLL